MIQNILIMGPIHVGKSSVSEELARRTGLKLVKMDDERARIYGETDYSNEIAETEYTRHGILGWYHYQKPYELYSVKKLLSESTNAIIDFGGGQSVYHDPGQADEFLRIMAKQPYTFLLMPYPDAGQSLELLARRTQQHEVKMNRLFVESQTNREAAKYTIYTAEKSVEKIADEIMSILYPGKDQRA